MADKQQSQQTSPTDTVEDPYDKFTEDTSQVFDVRKAKFQFTKERATIQLENERWKNRRRMAWIALLSIIVATAAMFTVVPESRLQALDNVVSWFMMGMVSIVGTYIGTATWANVADMRSRRSMGDDGNPWNSYGGGRLNNPDAQKSDYYSDTGDDNNDDDDNNNR